MNTGQKAVLTRANQNPRFNRIMRSLTIGVELPALDRDYALACAILFLKEYEADRRWTTYAELAYYIILKYSLANGEFQALFDFTANFGYYPITHKLLADGLVGNQNVLDQLVDIRLEEFRKENYIETLHQSRSRLQLMANMDSDIVYIAPTSFGKSSVIVDFIRQSERTANKIAIIVPTKSLLMQTYRMIRRAQLGKRVIMHDEMYNDDESFIAVFTQERCLRLMSRTNISFDLLFIDEAHNLLEDDDRSVLLSRLLIRNKDRNPNQRVVYLSPLIEDGENVKVDSSQQIAVYTIPFNIKEPDIFEFRSDKKKYQYNRFVNEFYIQTSHGNIFDYIRAHAKFKNFLYCYRPKKVEELAKELSESLPRVTLGANLRRVIATLRNEVHELFYLIDYLEYGVVYLHGKLPDLIKEYLESKFSEIPELKYLVANTVILEGVNLPIDNLYILNTYRLHGKELTNLIGRVNRLNTIFAEGTPSDALNKLLPPVHFVNNDKYNKVDGKMTGKIQELRSRIFKDVVSNCTLENYNVDALNLKSETKKRKRDRDQLTLRDEAVLIRIPRTRKDRLRQYLIESGITTFYNDVEIVLDRILNSIESIRDSNANDESLDFLEKIHLIFITDCQEDISDYSFRRLAFESTRNFYGFYIRVVQKRALKQNIKYLVQYYKREVSRGNTSHYFGESYGNQPSPFRPSHRREYLDLSNATNDDLVNLAIVKLKMENDFVSFKLNKFIVMLHDYELITTDEFNELIYGTTDQRKIEMTKMGMSISLIKRLDEDGLLVLLEFDANGNLIASEEFNRRKSEMSDLYLFEVNRFLS